MKNKTNRSICEIKEYRGGSQKERKDIHKYVAEIYIEFEEYQDYRVENGNRKKKKYGDVCGERERERQRETDRQREREKDIIERNKNIKTETQ